MKVYGLTGGIASGKSTASTIFQRLGVDVLDADQIAREVVQPGEPALEEIAAAFGPHALLPDGRLDRKAIASIVFSDPVSRKRLEAITHPRIAERILSKLASLAQEGKEAAIVEAALMVESGSHRRYDGLIVVHCSSSIQLERLMSREGMAPETAQKWIDAQLPQETKTALADWAIENNGTEAELRQKITKYWPFWLQR
jgi:dephospho-CoA kinase